MTDQTLLICGLPGSGKTTFLAALWHLLHSREISTEIEFASLKRGDAQHLNSIAARWRALSVQERTLPTAQRLVTMHLQPRAGGDSLLLSFPDLSGEAFGQMWETRECTANLRDIATASSGVIVFIQANNIQKPLPLVELAALQAAAGEEAEEQEPVNWAPRDSPTQVQVVELLQMLSTPPLAVAPRRISVVLSAWDQVAPEGRPPHAFLIEHLPLLAQYLTANSDRFACKVFGVSAQGGDITLAAELERLSLINAPSERIQVVAEDGASHDLSRILLWAMK